MMWVDVIGITRAWRIFEDGMKSVTAICAFGDNGGYDDNVATAA